MLCLSETRSDHEKVGTIFASDIPEGWEMHWNFHKRRKGYSGVAIFTKVKPLSVRHGLGIEKHDVEGRCLTMEFENFFIVTCYVPTPSDQLKRIDYRLEWDRDFFSYLRELEKSKPVVLGGDMNVAHCPMDVHEPETKTNLPSFSE